MRLSPKSISELGKVVTGDGGMSPYRSGPELVDLFNEFGANDSYGAGFPSRWHYAEQQIKDLNGTSAIAGLIKRVLDPREFIGDDYELEDVVSRLNLFLQYDGYRLQSDGKFFEAMAIDGAHVEFTQVQKATNPISRAFIQEQDAKCSVKISTRDFDGAITNARSLLEAVLLDIERELGDSTPEYNGDMPRLYKRVQKLLNLAPGRDDISKSLKSVLAGLINIVNGLAAVRNKMGDAHAVSYRAHEHHATLAVNAAKTAAEFLFGTKEFQKKKGFLEKSP